MGDIFINPGYDGICQIMNFDLSDLYVDFQLFMSTC